ncbi:MAG TPA: hypothetical protein VF618_27185 [Thermoanaerobaculia bacterium]
MKKVTEVLEGLREEQRRLVVELSGVERAIAALEEVLGNAPPAAPERLPATASQPSVPRTLLAAPAPHGSPVAPVAPPPPGPYTRYSGVYEAAEAYLRDAGEPKTAKEIAAGLRAGGFVTRAQNFSATVRTMLQRLYPNNEYGIQQTETPGHWTLRSR